CDGGAGASASGIGHLRQGKRRETAGGPRTTGAGPLHRRDLPAGPRIDRRGWCSGGCDRDGERVEGRGSDHVDRSRGATVVWSGAVESHRRSEERRVGKGGG